MKLRRFFWGLGSASALGASGAGFGQEPKIDPTLMPVVTSIVISAPYGQPPEIRITVSSPYAGPQVNMESKTTVSPPMPRPQPRQEPRQEPSHKPTAAPAPAPAPERPPTASIGPPAEGAPRIMTIPAAPPRPKSYAERAAQIEAPYRRQYPQAR